MQKLKPLKEHSIGGVPHYCTDDVKDLIVTELVNGTMDVGEKRKETDESLKKTSATLDRIELMRKVILEKRNEYVALEKEITELTNKAAGRIRQSAEKLDQSLIKFSKVSNLGSLETQAKQITDIAAALEAIAKLSESGALEKIGKMLSTK